MIYKYWVIKNVFKLDEKRFVYCSIWFKKKIGRYVTGCVEVGS